VFLYRFRRKNEENVEANQKCQYASQAAGQWLGLRLQFIGVAMVTGIGVIAMLQHQFNVADPGIYKSKFGSMCTILLSTDAIPPYRGGGV
jgi:hypothetical protein